MASSSQPDKKRKLPVATAASGPATTAASHAAFLVRDGRPVRAGPIFHGADTTAAMRWCVVNQQIAEAAAAGGGDDDGVWMVFALTSITPVIRPSPQPIRAFLLPAKGKARELLLPSDRIREAISAAVIGDSPANCRVVRFDFDFHNDHGHFAFWYNEDGDRLHTRPPRNRAITALVGDTPFYGDVVIARVRGGYDDDCNDPLPIHDCHQPTDWAKLLVSLTYE